ncbi:MAG: hypothetical protein KatS3mg014_2253 [Actinomycetota bacterium]|nr:MAG: hypothetical protein KatS3mg014_2253 [Actinomycetota bacterium]
MSLAPLLPEAPGPLELEDEAEHPPHRPADLGVDLVHPPQGVGGGELHSSPAPAPAPRLRLERHLLHHLEHGFDPTGAVLRRL